MKWVEFLLGGGRGADEDFPRTLIPRLWTMLLPCLDAQDGATGGGPQQNQQIRLAFEEVEEIVRQFNLSGFSDELIICMYLI